MHKDIINGMGLILWIHLVQLLNLATIHLLLSLVVTNNWHITQLDISNTFLHRNLDETVYMSQPPNFADPSRPDHVYLLKRSLYGLKHVGNIKGEYYLLEIVQVLYRLLKAT